MKKYLIFYFLLLLSFFGYSQNRNSVWCFGDSAGINFNGSSAIPFNTSLDSRGSAASISDTSGNLIFYVSDSPDAALGISLQSGKVRNSLHQLVDNGDSLVGYEWYRELLITDFPGANNKYLVFSAGVLPDSGIFYSIIDMNFNGGFGKVVQKNIRLNNFECSDGLTAVKHGNGRDWWVLFRSWDNVNDAFYEYLVSPSGISNLITQNIGTSTDNNLTKLSFNKAGDKLSMVNYYGLIEIFDFDRCSGTISNTLTIESQPTAPPLREFWSSEFSTNGRFLYVTAYYDTCYLYQYDLLSANPAATRITLDTITNDLIGIGNLKLAPDGKIYLSNAWESTFWCYPYQDTIYNSVNMNLSVINYPDSLGSACGYLPYSFYLNGKRTYYGLPNNPDYDMSALSGSSCDTITGLSPSPSPKESGAELFVFYHNDWQKLFVNAQNINGKNCLLQIFDVNGKEVFSSQKKTTPPYFTQDVSLEGIASGMYVVRLTTEKETMTKKFVRK